MNIIKNDYESIKRMCFEAVEDLKLEGIMYAELRYDPHLLINESDDFSKVEELTILINQWIYEASIQFEIEVRLILCVIRNLPQFAIHTATMTTQANLTT